MKSGFKCKKSKEINTN